MFLWENKGNQDIRNNNKEDEDWKQLKWVFLSVIVFFIVKCLEVEHLKKPLLVLDVPNKFMNIWHFWLLLMLSLSGRFKMLTNQKKIDQRIFIACFGNESKVI